MPGADRDNDGGELAPPGRRWGAGAQSVLPFLTRSFQARPANALEAREPRTREGHPVFRDWQPRHPRA
jgi:hypothetical protein